MSLERKSHLNFAPDDSVCTPSLKMRSTIALRQICAELNSAKRKHLARQVHAPIQICQDWSHVARNNVWDSLYILVRHSWLSLSIIVGFLLLSKRLNIRLPSHDHLRNTSLHPSQVYVFLGNVLRCTSTFRLELLLQSSRAHGSSGCGGTSHARPNAEVSSAVSGRLQCA